MIVVAMVVVMVVVIVVVILIMIVVVMVVVLVVVMVVVVIVVLVVVIVFALIVAELVQQHAMTVHRVGRTLRRALKLTCHKITAPGRDDRHYLQHFVFRPRAGAAHYLTYLLHFVFRPRAGAAHYLTAGYPCLPMSSVGHEQCWP